MNEYNSNNHDGFGNFDEKFHVGTPEETAARLSRRQLEQFAVDLQGRDTAILSALQNSRYMTSGQISRQHFEADHANPDAAQRATNRAMHRLQGYGLISSLNRRVGGVKGGSTGYVWGLTPPGVRFMNLGQDDQPRKRNHCRNTWWNNQRGDASPYMENTSTCFYCGREFESHSRRQRYCSLSCQQADSGKGKA